MLRATLPKKPKDGHRPILLVSQIPSEGRLNTSASADTVPMSNASGSPLSESSRGSIPGSIVSCTSAGSSRGSIPGSIISRSLVESSQGLNHKLFPRSIPFFLPREDEAAKCENICVYHK